MSHRIEFSPEAQGDLIDLYDYIALRDCAIGYIDRIEDCCRNLSVFPEPGIRSEGGYAQTGTADSSVPLGVEETVGSGRWLRRRSGGSSSFRRYVSCAKPEMYSGFVRFEWDDAKDEINRKKHGISFNIATRVFDDPNLLQYVERVENGEERWHAIGYVSGSLLLLTVVRTWAEKGAEEVVRIVSARPASSY